MFPQVHHETTIFVQLLNGPLIMLVSHNSSTPRTSVRLMHGHISHELRNEVVEELICSEGGKSRAHLSIEGVRGGRKGRKERETGSR